MHPEAYTFVGVARTHPYASDDRKYCWQASRLQPHLQAARRFQEVHDDQSRHSRKRGRFGSLPHEARFQQQKLFGLRFLLGNTTQNTARGLID
jgi:hypothetical protein